MLNIPVIKGNISKALKHFKSKFKDTQVLKEIRERKNYTKPSAKRKVKKDEAIRKLKKQQDNE